MSRARLLVILIVLVAVGGCGLMPFSAMEPRARLRPRPGQYREAIYVRPERSDGEQFYWSESPDARMSEFEWFDGVFVSGNFTFRYYTISRSGVRSPLIEAEYTIKDDLAPTISAAEVRQEAVTYWGYRIVWSVVPPWIADDPSGAVPHDDVTPWEELQFAVYSSTSNDIETIAQAEASGTIELSWLTAREMRDLSYDPGSGVTADELAGTLGVRYAAGRPGERRFFNVFVRDRNGNTSSYGTRSFTSRRAQSIYVGEDGLGDRIHLNNAAEVPPGGAPSMTDYLSSPWADDALGSIFSKTRAVALGRIDGDVYDDLAIVYEDLGAALRYRWYRGRGSGTYAGNNPVVEFMQTPSDGTRRTIDIADLTGDGVADIVFNTHDGTSYRLHVFDRNGNERFQTIAHAAHFVVGDVNGNGVTDVVTMDAASGIIEVWRNSGSGALSLISQPLAVPPVGFTDIELADLDRDGIADLLVVTPSPLPGDSVVEIHYGTSSGEFGASTVVPWPDFSGTTSVSVLDFNRDGWPDLFLGNSTTLSSLYLGNGDRTFTQLLETGATYSADSFVADVNGDGWPDVIELFTSGSPILWLNQGGFAVAESTAIGSTSTRMIATGQVR